MPRRLPALCTPLISLALVCVLLACAPVTGSAAESPSISMPSSATAAPSSMPPALAQLAQQMSQLRPSTIRASLTFGLQGEDAKAPGGKVSVVMSRVLAEVGSEPPLASVTHGAEAGPEGEKVRLVNGYVYRYLPFLGRFDGKRPWVKMSEARYEREDGGQASVALAQQTSPSIDPYANLAAEIDSSSDFRELGVSEVDGQAVTGFAMTPPASRSRTPGQSGFTPKEEAELKAAFHGLGKVTSTLEVLIAADGLPVRTRTTVGAERLAWVAGMEVAAIDFPLAVLPPPAKQTIDYRALRKIETKLTPPLRSEPRRTHK
jgi:hypothetical protein